MKHSAVKGKQPQSLISIIILTLLLTAAVTFFATRQFTYHSAYQKGKDASWKAGWDEGYDVASKSQGTELMALQTRNSELVSQYNNLSDNYNSLRDAVTRYVGANSYQPSSRITCNSSTYGMNSQFSTTTCY